MTDHTENMSATVTDAGARANTVGLLRLAIDHANRQGQDCGVKFSMTIQARESVAAMRALGVPRSAFRSRTKYDRRTGEYGACLTSALTRDAVSTIVANAEALAEVGFSVHVIKRADGAVSSAFFGTGARHGSVTVHGAPGDA